MRRKWSLVEVLCGGGATWGKFSVFGGVLCM